MTFVYSILIFLLTLVNSVYTENPYRILNTSPFLSQKDIKKVYKKLSKKTHPDLAKFYERDNRKKVHARIQKAWEEIKDSRANENENRNGFIIACKRTIVNITISSVVIVIIYLFTLFVHRVVSYVLKFSLILVAVFFFFDNMLGHLFEKEDDQYTYSFLVALVINITTYYIFRKKSI